MLFCIDRVKHLILADPWGFPDKPKELAAPLWVRAIAYMVTPLNPLWALRAAGPYGQWVVQKTRPDLLRKFQDVVKTEESIEDVGQNTIAQYIHQCNAQTPTYVIFSIFVFWQTIWSYFSLCVVSFCSGESAFHAMMSGFGWAKNPMLNRMHDVREDKPITLLYGSRSWIDKSSWDLVKESRPSSYVNVQVRIVHSCSAQAIWINSCLLLVFHYVDVEYRLLAAPAITSLLINPKYLIVTWTKPVNLAII